MEKPAILLQMGDQLDNTPFLQNENISAIVWGGYTGQDGGKAVMNVGTGKVMPAGRLPVTQYPANYTKQVPMTDMNLRPNTTSGNPGRTYNWFPNHVQEFGYGLHYSTFSLSLASQPKSSYEISSPLSSCDEKHKDLCPFDMFDVDIKNTGSVASDFVTLAFISGEYGPAPYPIKQLVAYQRVFKMTSGSSQAASLNITLGSLARYDEDGNAILYAGDYSMLLDVPTAATINFTLTGNEFMLDEWPKRPARG